MEKHISNIFIFTIKTKLVSANVVLTQPHHGVIFRFPEVMKRENQSKIGDRNF